MSSMDWNTILFAARWVIAALFYTVLMILLIGVYRETASRVVKKPEKAVPMFGRLRVIHPGGDMHLASGAVIGLKPVTNLGTAPDNDVIVGDMFVSGHHFRLRWDGAKWWLEDLNSKNGTFHNRQLIPAAQPVVVQRGATITAGDMVMELID